MKKIAEAERKRQPINDNWLQFDNVVKDHGDMQKPHYLY